MTTRVIFFSSHDFLEHTDPSLDINFMSFSNVAS